MRLQTCLKIAGTALATAGLAACGGGGGDNSSATSPITSNSLESKFGSEFAKIFDAPSTSQPAIPDSSAVPPLAPAAQPIAVP